MIENFEWTDESTARGTAERIEAWLSEHLESDACVVASGTAHISFGMLMENFRREFIGDATESEGN